MLTTHLQCAIIAVSYKRLDGVVFTGWFYSAKIHPHIAVKGSICINYYNYKHYPRIWGLYVGFCHVPIVYFVVGVDRFQSRWDESDTLPPNKKLDLAALIMQLFQSNHSSRLADASQARLAASLCLVIVDGPFIIFHWIRTISARTQRVGLLYGTV